MAETSSEHGWGKVIGFASGSAAVTIGVLVTEKGQEMVSGALGMTWATIGWALLGMVWLPTLLLAVGQVRQVLRARSSASPDGNATSKAAEARARGAERETVRAYILAVVKHADYLVACLPRDGQLIEHLNLKPRPIIIRELFPSAPQYRWFPEWVEINQAIRLMQEQLARLDRTYAADGARFQAAIAEKSLDPDPRKWTLGGPEWVKWAKRQREAVRGLCESARARHPEIDLAELPPVQDEDEAERLRFEDGLFEKAPPRFAEVLVKRTTATMEAAVVRARAEGAWPSGVTLDIDRMDKTRRHLIGYPGNGNPFAEFVGAARHLDILIADHRLGKPTNVNTLLKAAEEILERGKFALPDLNGLN